MVIKADGPRHHDPALLRGSRLRRAPLVGSGRGRSCTIKARSALFGRGDDTVGDPHRARNYRFELFELVLLLKLDKQLPVEQFEASRAIRGSSISVSSTLPPLIVAVAMFGSQL